jgi:hypothetical protein
MIDQLLTLGAGGSAELDIGGPGGGTFTVKDTFGLTASTILSDLEAQIPTFDRPQWGCLGRSFMR